MRKLHLWTHFGYRPGWQLMTHSKRGKPVMRYFYPKEASET